MATTLDARGSDARRVRGRHELVRRTLVGRYVVGRGVVGPRLVGRLVVGCRLAMSDQASPLPTGSADAPRRLAPALSVIVLTTALAAAAVVVAWSTAGGHLRFAPGPWWALGVATIGFLVAERYVFNVEYRRESVSFSLAEVPLAFALVFVGPVGAMAARVVGSIAALVLGRRAKPLKLAFNVTLFAFQTAATAAMVRVIVTPEASGGALIGALVVAIAAGCVIGGVLVSVAVSFFEGGFTRRLVDELRTGSAVYVLGAVVGALSVTPALIDWRLTLMPVVPIIGLWQLLLSRGVLAQQYRDLEALHAFTGSVTHSLELHEVIETACAEACSLLRADHAALVVFDDRRAAIGRAIIGEPGLVPDGVDTDWTELLETPGVHTVSSAPTTVSASPSPFASVLASAGRTEALVAPVADDQGLLAVLVLVDRAGVVDRFSDDDRRRVAPLVAQLAVALRKVALHQQVEREATHDRLTGLPARALLEAELTGALASHDDVGVLMLDVDRFKEINDTLGHHAGDAVLREFARRVTNAVGERGLLARFAGDEFAVVLRGCSKDDAAMTGAAILEELRPPFDVCELTVAVACSIGAACSPTDGDDGVDLLRRADLAMYEAKGRSSGFEPYRPDMDINSADRLALLGELRGALDTDEIEVFFQPKIDLDRDVVVGAEALVRWQHPRLGLLAADRFISIAERTDLIHRLSEIVLTQSLAAVAHWRRQGLELGVAVNYSARSLFDELLADRIARQLDIHGVPAELLTIEVTESSVMSDVGRAASVLQRLRALGVEISVDDYGTGHSSLAYLRRLPVTELKIDRAFVTNMLIEPDDEIIVRSTIDLARNLGLRVVAEGIESGPVATRLHELGCDLGQGYGFSRPLPLAKFDAWLSVATQRPSVVR